MTAQPQPTDLYAHIGLGDLHAQLGDPPAWRREPGFATLLHIILEQQVSLASAQAAFNRLQAALPVLTPTAFLGLDDANLKRIGFSHQKTRYGRALATALLDGNLDLEALHRCDEATIRRELTRLPGIGDWTVDIYLLMALDRPDVWPKGDLALAMAAQEVLGLSSRPPPSGLEALAERWRPHRSAAARLLWHHYLMARKR